MAVAAPPFKCFPPSKMQTGGLVAKGIGAAHYKSFVIDDTNWPPRFCKIELKLEDGTQVGAREGRPMQQPWAACSAELGCCTYALRECMCMSSALTHAEERHGWTCLSSWGCMSARCSVPTAPHDAWWSVCMPPIPLHGPPLSMPLLHPKPLLPTCCPLQLAFCDSRRFAKVAAACCLQLLPGQSAGTAIVTWRGTCSGRLACTWRGQFAPCTSAEIIPSRSCSPQVRFLENPEGCPPISQLGWDPLLNMPSLDEFSSALAKQRRAVKALLLDQVRGWGEGYGQLLGWNCCAGAPACHSRNIHSVIVHKLWAVQPGPCMPPGPTSPPNSVLMRLPILQSFSAGIGNWVADEVLYQVRPPCCAAVRSGRAGGLVDIMGQACPPVHALVSGCALSNTYMRWHLPVCHAAAASRMPTRL